MNKAILSLLLAFTATALLSVTSATNTACFNANGEITQVFCDGVDITKRLPNRANVNKCDCIRLDICANVTIRAKGVKNGGQSRSGIGMCQTANPTAYANWACTKSTHNKRWKSQGMSYQRWRPAQKTRTKRCHKVKRLPCKQSMFWNDGIDSPSVDCIRQQCGEECKSCAKTGPGKCDPGMCYFGEGVNYYTNAKRCNRRCRVDWLAWGWRSTPTTTGKGYIRLTDMRSHSREIFLANVPGYYLGLIDLNQCVFINKTYTTWKWGEFNVYGETSGDSQVNQWVEDDSMMNVIGVELMVGGVSFKEVGLGTFPEYGPSFAPAATLYRFGTGVRDLPINYNRNCSLSAIITGFQYAPTTIQMAVKKPGTYIYPNNGC